MRQSNNLGSKSVTLEMTRGVKIIALLGLATFVASCGMPRSGPTKNQIMAGSVEKSGNAHIVNVDDRVAQVTAVSADLSFSSTFENAGLIGSDTISPGDVLGITVWENVDQGILANEGSNAAALEEVQVDGAGFVYVPYAGRIRAAGNTPEALRQAITRQLEAQTPDPQVMVRRVAGDGSSVSVIGSVGAQGVYSLQRPTRTLTAMLARAGGVSIEPEIAQITVIRGNNHGKIWLQDLYADARNDIALRPDDRILVEEDTRAFTAIGATGAQNRVTFDNRELSAIEAIAQVGGLNPNFADPTGVFVFRDEEPSIANQVLGRGDLQGSQRMVYIIDLTDPTGVFTARDFIIRDEDTIYVTEAPFAQWQKILGALTGTASSVNALNNLANGD